MNSALPRSTSRTDDLFCKLPNGIRLCYRSYGQEGDDVILLIAGLGLQLVYWPKSLVQSLVTAGFRVVAIDNRDAGRSSRLPIRNHGKWRQLFSMPRKENYSIEDMADDTASLIRKLALRRVHAVGMSMGGMIAQSLAARHPDLVDTLTSIFSKTGRWSSGHPALSTYWLLAKGKTPQTQDEAIQRHVLMMTKIGDPTYSQAHAAWREYAAEAWVRNGYRGDGSAVSRQIAAIQKSGDRTSSLRKVRAPTLVIHGEVDRLVHPSGGKATAAAIPGARLVTIQGLRHQIDDQQAGPLSGLILAHIKHPQHSSSDASGNIALTPSLQRGSP